MKEPEARAADQKISPSYRTYVLLALTGVYIFNFIDRQILVILQESIKADLGLSDLQLGLLTGFAFAVFYVTLGIPIARFADKANRKNIIAISLTIWSAMTALSGMAQNFVQLLLARMGVGIGEAGGSPPAHSMISDYYPEEKRATALSVYSMGIYIGILMGYLFGGWLDEFIGWRNSLLILGLPGILYAIFFYFTVKEPPRGYSEKRNRAGGKEHSMLEVFELLLNRRAFIFLALAAGINAFVVYGVGNFLPSFLSRIHEMGKGEIGTWLALGSGGGGALGVWLGGYLGDKFGQVKKSWYMLIPSIAILISIPLTLIVLFSSNKLVVVSTNFVVKALWSMYLAPCIAMAHGMVGLRMRALSSAVLFLVLNFIGLGLGPTFFGFISDLFTADMGTEGIRRALSLGIGFSLIAAIFLYLSSRYLEEDLARAPD